MLKPSTDRQGLWSLLRNPSIARVIILVNLIILLTTGVAAAVFLRSLSELQVHGPVYERIKSASDLTADILPPPLYILETYLTLYQLRDANGAEEIRGLETHLDQLEKDFEGRQAYWATHGLPADMKDMLEAKVAPEARKIFEEVRAKFLPALRNRNAEEVDAALAEIGGIYSRHRNAVNDLVKLASASVESAEAAATSSKAHYLWLIYGILGLTMAVAITGGVILVRRISRPIAAAKDAIAQLAGGDDAFEITGDERRDEIGQMWQAMRKLRDAVAKAFELRQLVEELPINVMQCEPQNFKVTFMNRSTRETLKKLEHMLPCKVEQILGQSIDIFHKNPEHQRRILRDPKNLPYTAKIRLGEESLSLNVAAIMDRKGNYMGPVLTWNVVTAQVQMANRVKDVVGIVASAASEMEASAQSMSATAEETNRQSTAVAAASEQAATNVQTVASAAEELSASIREIQQQMTNSARIAQQAVEQVDRTDTTVTGLVQAADKIGEVVNLISDIASQTNLLALNATIEAARAGEAGKGFAVVASEVKNLANQTAKATEEIGQQIAAMQTATGDSVQAIRGIGETIKQISEVTTAVASAVEEQGAATQEISRNVQQASAGTQEVSSNITGVSQAATQTGTAAGQVLNAARELAQQGQQLNTEIEAFLRSA
jgi:methyl-accepting chemotaxis protein